MWYCDSRSSRWSNWCSSGFVHLPSLFHRVHVLHAVSSAGIASPLDNDNNVILLLCRIRKKQTSYRFGLLSIACTPVFIV